jgi:hypothetical protein
MSDGPLLGLRQREVAGGIEGGLVRVPSGLRKIMERERGKGS